MTFPDMRAFRKDPVPRNPCIDERTNPEAACDQCGEEREVLVRVGDEPGWESRWVDLCEQCLRLALDHIARTVP